MAQFTDLEQFQHPSFTPLRLSDAHGYDHEFHFRSLLLGDQLSLEAFELMDGDDSVGYRFQSLGDPESDPFALLGQLVQKIQRALAATHLVADAGGCSSPTRRSGVGSSGTGSKTEINRA
ncbi:DUF7686 domain-containing protein [Caballeronia glebae]|jgi:hypothetical protein|uniref:DUF7686 domain-containing protein n=1 Tax=Caballeronia glebae TaxID=1777143 RepID=UPI0038BCF89C